MLAERLCFLPRLDKLQRLVLCSSERFTYGNTGAVLELLHATPFLKYLVIDVVSPQYFCPLLFAYFLA